MLASKRRTTLDLDLIALPNRAKVITPDADPPQLPIRILRFTRPSEDLHATLHHPLDERSSIGPPRYWPFDRIRQRGTMHQDVTQAENQQHRVWRLRRGLSETLRRDPRSTCDVLEAGDLVNRSAFNGEDGRSIVPRALGRDQASQSVDVRTRISKRGVRTPDNTY